MVDSIVLAKYFFYLDKRKNIFRDPNPIHFQKDSKTNPTAGNFKLNKFLFIANVLYIAKNNEPLFYNEIHAFEYGPVVFNVFKNIKKIKEETIKSNDFSDLDESTRKYIKKIYKIFSKYNERDLLSFVHDDPHWFLAYDRWKNSTTKEKKNIKSVLLFNQDSYDFYKNHLNIYIKEFKL